jgi:hypothetical protein
MVPLLHSATSGAHVCDVVVPSTEVAALAKGPKTDMIDERYGHCNQTEESGIATGNARSSRLPKRKHNLGVHDYGINIGIVQERPVSYMELYTNR